MLGTILLGLALFQAAGNLDEELLAAARKGELAQVKALLEKGANLEAKTRHGVTPLFYAASRGHVEVLRYLIDKGADVKVQDTFYRASALDFTLQNEHVDAARLLIEKGAIPNSQTLMGAIMSDRLPALKMLLSAAKFKPEELSSALAMAQGQKKTEAAALLLQAGAKPPETKVKLSDAALAGYAGTFKSDQLELKIEAKEGKLVMAVQGQSFDLIADSETAFRPAAIPGLKLTFKLENGKAAGIDVEQGPRTTNLKRVEN